MEISTLEMQIENILEVRDLTVKVKEKIILDGINLALSPRESYIIFGPNGSGKTSLMYAIMGIPPFEVDSGEILFMGRDITKMTVYERSNLGISMGFQHPPQIRGVKLGHLLKICLGKGIHYNFSQDEKALIDTFKLTQFLERDLNVGYSGGERKRAEILQILFLKPKLMILDEPDSGVDIDSLKLIADKIQEYLDMSGSTALIITHKGDILNHIRSKYACIIMNGRNHCFNDPRKIYDEINEFGYDHCVTCNIRDRNTWLE
jgi:Fe-S cluster assembly ATP-binding protein